MRPVSGVSPGPRREEPIHFGRSGGTVLLGVVEVAPRLGIGVGTAADDRHRHRAGRLTLDLIAGVSGPLGADLVELAPQGRAMAGVTEQDSADLAGRVARDQHRQARVDRPVRIDAETDPLAILEHPTVGREARPALTPGQARRCAILQRRQGGVLHRVGQRFRITLDPRPLVGRERIAEDEVQPAAQGRAQCVCVEQTTNRSRFNPTFLFRRAATSSVTFEPDRAVVHGHQHCGTTCRLRRRPRSPAPGP